MDGRFCRLFNLGEASYFVRDVNCEGRKHDDVVGRSALGKDGRAEGVIVIYLVGGG